MLVDVRAVFLIAEGLELFFCVVALEFRAGDLLFVPAEFDLLAVDLVEEVFFVEADFCDVLDLPEVVLLLDLGVFEEEDVLSAMLVGEDYSTNRLRNLLGDW